MELFSTRKEQMAALEAAGVTNGAAEIMDRLLGGGFHRAGLRVQATLDIVEGTDENLGAGVGALLLAADLVGVGGTAGVTGEGTARLATFAGLGSGRKQATDGQAWMAAAREALTSLVDGPYCPTPMGWDVAEEGDIVFRSKDGATGDLLEGYASSAGEALPAAWRKAIAARGLAAAIGCQIDRQDDGQSVAFCFGNATAAQWAGALNKALEEDRLAATSEYFEVAKDYGATGEED